MKKQLNMETVQEKYPVIHVEFWNQPPREVSQFWVDWILEGKEIPPVFIAYRDSDISVWDNYTRPAGKGWYVYGGEEWFMALRSLQTKDNKLSCWAIVTDTLIGQPVYGGVLHNLQLLRVQ
jgi:hypothetical protein